MDPPVLMLTAPADICNQAIDVLGEPGKIIGDINDGTTLAETARRNYGQVLRQLLRANHWPFARKMAQLQLLGDATGQSALPVIQTVEPPWTYAYAWPTDAVQGRWMPAGFPLTSPPNQPNPPFSTQIAAPWLNQLCPGRFLVSSSNLYPVETGFVPWDQLPDLRFTEGLGPINRKILLTDICQAWFVYTRLVTVVEEWDDDFRDTMVALMAIVLAPVAIDDPRSRWARRNEQVGIAKNKLADARVAAGNEAGFPQSVEHTPNWITARNGGMYYGGYNGGFGDGTCGGLYAPWDSFSLGGNVF